MTAAERARVVAATVQFPQRGQGILVPGGLVLTAAHVIEWSHEGRMALGDEVEFVQPIEAGPTHEKLRVYPLAVEPLADLAILGALDGQWSPEDAEAFERFCDRTPAVPLATQEYPLGKSIPAFVLTHEGRWIDVTVTQQRARSPRLWLESKEPIKGGTSGGPVVTARGHLLGVVSWTGGGAAASGQSGAIPRVRWAAPAWLLPHLITRRPSHRVEDYTRDEVRQLRRASRGR